MKARISFETTLEANDVCSTSDSTPRFTGEWHVSPLDSILIVKNELGVTNGFRWFPPGDFPPVISPRWFPPVIPPPRLFPPPPEISPLTLTLT